MLRISIHALLAESDDNGRILSAKYLISIHALLAESDLRPYHGAGRQQPISIHALLAESDLSFAIKSLRSRLFLSTLSLRRATPAPVPCRPHAHISIHALLAESDGCQWGPGIPDFNFYPRSPCGERPRGSASMPRYLNFYPRSPCGERPRRAESPVHTVISIHALLAESDFCDWRIDTCIAARFLSTLSLRRATQYR